MFRKFLLKIVNRISRKSRETKIYFDTEFTGLHQETTLISMGLVSDTGRKFYAEFSDYDHEQCDEWIQANVISKLLYSDKLFTGDITTSDFAMRGDKIAVSQCLSDWLAQFDSVQLVSDVSHYDFVLFCELFGGAFGLPKNVSPTCYDINQDIATYLNISQREAFDVNRETFSGLLFTIGLKTHNALWDAEVIKKCYEIIHG